VDYEVVEKGSTGLLGFIGSKPAIIRAWVKAEALEDEIIAETVFENEERREREEEELKAGIKDAHPLETAKDESLAEHKVHEATAQNTENQAWKTEEDKTENKVLEKTEGKAEDEPEELAEGKEEEAPAQREKRPPAVFDSQMVEDSEKFLQDIFRTIDMEVKIETSFEDETGTLEINLIGQNMGILIGKRGQTLDSLQYLISLVVNKNRDNYIRVKLDTENYRERRKETLETLARNIASKVRRTKRPVSLEPMNPYERRVIHSTLQNDKYVLTRSEGEEPYRHVVVFLKRERYHKS